MPGSCQWVLSPAGQKRPVGNIPTSGHFHPIDMGFIDPYPEPKIAYGPGKLTKDIDTIWRK